MLNIHFIINVEEWFKVDSVRNPQLKHMVPHVIRILFCYFLIWFELLLCVVEANDVLKTINLLCQEN